MKPAPESQSAFEMFLACTHLGFITLAICGNASQLAAQVLPISARSCYDQRRESMMVKSQSQRFVSSSYRRVHPLLSAIFAFYCVVSQ
ncbi:hypothetical protein WR25_08659 [Diploscapter pachys]|uniref:Uncharacterized protein n=1 Tax=Diploscapter pachys TaxID=2018661 RepID=A0A2A2LNS3_9BILA|nr:hypothetical protein WR25_08659 [Diploscapter pachys]